jgi:ABC-type transport system involved in multi-copper enzyme maturation permease subunit
VSATATPVGRGRVRGGLGRFGGRVGGQIGSFLASVSAVGSKELRGRMRGRRAFIVLTIYLLLLSGFAYGIYEYLRQQSLQQVFSAIQPGIDPGFGGGFTTYSSTQSTALSATVGHAIYSGLLVVETLLVLVLAPAFTSGAVSLEREKQTLDLLVATPLSTFGMVLGKLLSALTWVFLLIVASVPLASVVFAFGGVGPEDLIRGYALLFALAFGMGAIGMFISALVRRTQTATVLTFVAVLVLTIGSMAVHEFWRVVTTPASSATNGFISVTAPARPPEALLWLNPFVGDMDLICTTAPGGYEASTCGYVAQVTGTPYFAATTPDSTTCFPGKGCILVPGVVAPVPVPQPGANGGAIVDVATAPAAGTNLAGGALVAVGPNAVVACQKGVCFTPPVNGTGTAQAVAADVSSAGATLGFPRDTFWPHNILGFVVVGVVLTLLSSQLVAPTRRWRLIPSRAHFGRPSLRRGAGRSSVALPAAINPGSEETISSAGASGSFTPPDLIAASETEDPS